MKNVKEYTNRNETHNYTQKIPFVRVKWIVVCDVIDTEMISDLTPTLLTSSNLSNLSYVSLTREKVVISFYIIQTEFHSWVTLGCIIEYRN